MSIEHLHKLRDELRALDIEIADSLRQLEQEYREYQLGIAIALGDQYMFAKVNGKWRFTDTDGRPVGDMNRNVRAAFMAEWGVRHNFEMAAELALRAAIEQRKSIIQ